jgi:hypothetical protein
LIFAGCVFLVEGHVHGAAAGGIGALRVGQKLCILCIDFHGVCRGARRIHISRGAGGTRQPRGIDTLFQAQNMVLRICSRDVTGAAVIPLPFGWITLPACAALLDTRVSAGVPTRHARVRRKSACATSERRQSCCRKTLPIQRRLLTGSSPPASGRRRGSLRGNREACGRPERP